MPPDLPAQRGESDVPDRSGAALRSRHLQVRGEPRFVTLRSSRPRIAPRPPGQTGRPGPCRSAGASRSPGGDYSHHHGGHRIQPGRNPTGYGSQKGPLVRSSRLPIIMDAAERHFGITIELEDFIHVRTVRDIARKISVIVARQEGSGERLAVKTAAPGAARNGARSRPRRRRG